MTAPVFPPKGRPLAIRAANGLGRLLKQFGLSYPTIDAARLEREAMSVSGLDDFGEGSWREGLAQLVHAMNKEAGLTLIGRIAAKKQLADALDCRLQMVNYRKCHPEIEQERIERPLFILGLPRTGTTILHSLLACDPAHRAPLTWEMQYPCPVPTPEDRRNDPRIARSAKGTDQLEVLAPGFKSIHDTDPSGPEECISMIASAFFQEQFSTVFRLPSYRRWYMQADPGPAYEWHRRFLQHLQSGDRPQRWVLKTPMHLPFLDTLFKTYPDAMVVQTHRDPATVMASVASLSCTLRSAFSDSVDPQQVGIEESEFFARVLRQGMERRDALGKADQIYDFRFQDIIDRPVAAIAEIYQHFGLAFTDEARSSIQEKVEQRPRNLHGGHRYQSSDFGLDESRLQQTFAEYRARYL